MMEVFDVHELHRLAQDLYPALAWLHHSVHSVHSVHFVHCRLR